MLNSIEINDKRLLEGLNLNLKSFYKIIDSRLQILNLQTCLLKWIRALNFGGISGILLDK